MSLTAKSGYVLSVTLVDNGNNESTKSFHITEDAVYADALTDAQSILTALDAITNAVIKSWSLAKVYEEDALVLPAEGIQVENTARVSALITNEVAKYAQFVIPAPVIGIFTGTSGAAANTVDGADADLGTFLLLFGAAGVATVSDGETIESPSTATVKGKRVHRASRKG